MDNEHLEQIVTESQAAASSTPADSEASPTSRMTSTRHIHTHTRALGGTGSCGDRGAHTVREHWSRRGGGAHARGSSDVEREIECRTRRAREQRARDLIEINDISNIEGKLTVVVAYSLLVFSQICDISLTSIKPQAADQRVTRAHRRRAWIRVGARESRAGRAVGDTRESSYSTAHIVYERGRGVESASE